LEEVGLEIGKKDIIPSWKSILKNNCIDSVEDLENLKDIKVALNEMGIGMRIGTLIQTKLSKYKPSRNETASSNPILALVQRDNGTEPTQLLAIVANQQTEEINKLKEKFKEERKEMRDLQTKVIIMQTEQDFKDKMRIKERESDHDLQKKLQREVEILKLQSQTKEDILKATKEAEEAIRKSIPANPPWWNGGWGPWGWGGKNPTYCVHGSNWSHCSTGPPMYCVHARAWGSHCYVP